jgi:hypothetical protein
MSYDIDVTTKDGAEHSLNWLRNPFGLCSFAEDNVGDGQMSLWHVCNDHAYDDVGKIDRAQFLRVVESYWDRLRGLDDAYFFFTFGSYVQFLPEYPDAMMVRGYRALVEATRWGDDGRLGIRIGRFQGYERQFGWRQTAVLDYYKEWFERLLGASRAMQDPDATIYISN